MIWENKSTNALSVESAVVSKLIPSPELWANPTSTTARTIAFVDPQIADVQAVMANLQSDVTVWLDPTQDGIKQITETLSHYQGLTGIEIISHGNVAQVQLGNNSLAANSLSQYAPDLQQWSTALAPNADILFYGCNIAAGVAGQNFVKELSNLTGADIAASTNLTGNAQRGGDWNLEYTTGKIETKTPFLASFTTEYQGLLASILTTQTPDNLNQSDGAGIEGYRELGVKFTSTKAGEINAIRYYKSPLETGNHFGNIWSSSGKLLGSVNFTGETASGWQQQSLTQPIMIAPNQTYIVSVNANSHFAVSGNFDNTITNGDLSAIADGNNGVYNTTQNQFPTASNNNNYFRDVVFTPTLSTTPKPTNTNENVTKPVISTGLISKPKNQVGKINVSGIATQNQTLTANVADADGLKGVKINYQWQQSKDGTTWSNITGATSNKLTLGQAQTNNRVRAIATYTDALGAVEKPISAPTTNVINVNDIGSISMSGTAAQNQTLTANVTDADGLKGVKINYQWQQSTDGTTWSNITGGTNNTLTLGQGQANNRVRATASYTDALGGVEQVYSLASNLIAPNKILGSILTTQTPDNLNQSDGAGSAGYRELGVKFTSTKAGEINAIRYYKSPLETGNHFGNIWSSSGKLLGSVNFTGETASGWQQQSLTQPIMIAPNQTYIVSVNANSHFAVSGNFDNTITNGDLSAIADGNNGVYNTTQNQFPTASNRNNYFRDVVFTPTFKVLDSKP